MLFIHTAAVCIPPHPGIAPLRSGILFCVSGYISLFRHIQYTTKFLKKKVFFFYFGIFSHLEFVSVI